MGTIAKETSVPLVRQSLDQVFHTDCFDPWTSCLTCCMHQLAKHELTNLYKLTQQKGLSCQGTLLCCRAQSPHGTGRVKLCSCPLLLKPPLSEWQNSATSSRTTDQVGRLQVHARRSKQPQQLHHRQHNIQQQHPEHSTTCSSSIPRPQKRIQSPQARPAGNAAVR